MQRVDSMLQGLTQMGVQVDMSQQVGTYLLEHEKVASILPGLVEDAKRQLGEQTRAVLEIDPSAGAGNEWLVLLLRPRIYDERIIEITRELSALASSQIDSKDWRFIVTTDFLIAS